MVDHAQALSLFVPRNRVFVNQNVPKWVVLHKTAGGDTVDDLGAYFASTDLWTSSTYGVGLDGRIAQFVLEQDGAAANCCVTAGHADFLQSGINYNLSTISIEHIDTSLDNSNGLTAAQKNASFALVADICKRQRIPARKGDANGGILCHHDFDPISRARCPGNYPLDELYSFLKGEVHVGIPQGWHDDGKTLVAPNDIPVTQGFRQFILNHPWDAEDYPLEKSKGVASVENSNHATGKGTVQTFRLSRLFWTEKTGVVLSWLGAELLWYQDALAREAATKVTTITKTQLPASVLADIRKLCLDAGVKLG